MNEDELKHHPPPIPSPQSVPATNHGKHILPQGWLFAVVCIGLVMMIVSFYAVMILFSKPVENVFPPTPVNTTAPAQPQP